MAMKYLPADESKMSLFEHAEELITSFLKKHHSLSDYDTTDKSYLHKLIVENLEKNWNRVLLEIHHNANGELNDLFERLNKNWGLDVINVKDRRSDTVTLTNNFSLAHRLKVSPKIFENPIISRGLNRYNTLMFNEFCDLTNATLDDIGMMFWNMRFYSDEEKDDRDEFMCRLAENRTLQDSHMQLFEDYIRSGGELTLCGRTYYTEKSRKFCYKKGDDLKKAYNYEKMLERGWIYWTENRQRHSWSKGGYINQFISLMKHMWRNPRFRPHYDRFHLIEFQKSIIGEKGYDTVDSINRYYEMNDSNVYGLTKCKRIKRVPTMADLIEMQHNMGFRDDVLACMTNVKPELVKKLQLKGFSEYSGISRYSGSQEMEVGGDLKRILDNPEVTQAFLRTFDQETFIELFPGVVSRPHKFYVETWMIEAVDNLTLDRFTENYSKIEKIKKIETVKISSANEELLIAYPNLKYSWKDVSFYGRISWKFVYDNINKPWDFEMLCANVDII